MKLRNTRISVNQLRALVVLSTLAVICIAYPIRQSRAAKDLTPAVGKTITVNTTLTNVNATDGLCSLGEAITAANTNTASGAVPGECVAGSNAGPDTINFTVSGPVSTSLGVTTITSSIIFAGPSATTLLKMQGHLEISAGSPEVVTFSDLELKGSCSGGCPGGVIRNLSNATVNITNSVFDSNAAHDGGAIWNNAGTVNVVRSTFTSNKAGQTGFGNGGAIANESGTINVSNSTFSGNNCDTSGGAIYNNTGTLNINDVTIADNRAPNGGGGGVFTNGPVMVRNTIIASNIASSAAIPNKDVFGPFTSQGHNLIGARDGSTGFTNGVNGDQVGTISAPIDPKLAPSANYGGPSFTRALLPGSPAIDAGDNCAIQPTHCSDGSFSQLTTDQRGFSRAVDATGSGTPTVDIGAFESRGFNISATSGTPQSAAVNTNFSQPLVATVTNTFGEPVNGGSVTFTAPTTGARATFAGNSTATVTIADGSAFGIPPGTATSPTLTANNVLGSYNISVGAIGIATPATFSLTNAQAATSTMVTSSLNPSDFSQSVTITATVTSSGQTPTGSVQFKIDGTNVGSPVSLNGSGAAQLVTSSLGAGSHVITANFSGGPNFGDSSGTLAGGQVVRSVPTLSINSVATSEGDLGTKTLTFTVTLSAASNLTVTTNFATANGSALASSDYVANSGTVTFNPGDLTKTIGVTINGDTTFEPDETFVVNLSNPVNATISTGQGTGTITNDDAQGGVLSFSLSNYFVNETDKFVTITVSRGGDVSGSATVDYATNDTGAPASCSTSNGTASSVCDYTKAAGTLKFVAGETSKQFQVLLTRDAYAEGAEVINMNLSNVTGGAVLGVPSTATVTIAANAALPANPIDDAQEFVRQQYHDFLNREPDASGLAFWTNQITSCGADAQCTEVRRINVSAAFFLSTEFQETGYLVERLNKASFGDAVGMSTFNGNHALPVPIVRFNEFMRDAQQISAGVIVNQPGWPDVLEANKQTFILEFVQRSQFVSLYPTTMTPAQFVDALYANTGVVPTAADRTAAINEFGSATNTANTSARARSLRRVAENSTFSQLESPRAFVLMEYFGYLRRNPNDPPDTNYSGYDFWLTKLNQFNGNYIAAEMVKAFISTDEYRRRFGS